MYCLKRKVFLNQSDVHFPTYDVFRTGFSGGIKCGSPFVTSECVYSLTANVFICVLQFMDRDMRGVPPL